MVSAAADPIRVRPARRRRLALAGLAVLLAAASPADPPRLAAMPPAVAPGPIASGFLVLAGGALAYVPPAAAAAGRPAPLLVLLHGAGQRGSEMLQRFQAEADRRGLVLLAPNSAGPTWDMTMNLRADYDGAAVTRAAPAPRPRFDRDPPRIDAALADLFARVPVDPARIGLLGFSDGATYAIPLGLANPRLFRAVMVMSPGMYHPPRRPRPGQRVFVAHGTGDRVLPYAYTRGTIVPGLRRLGMSVTFRTFDGGHTMPDDVAADALDFLLAGGTR